MPLNKKLYLIIITIVATLLAVSVAIALPMFAHADYFQENEEPQNSYEWNSLNIINSVALPANTAFSFAFTYHLNFVEDGVLNGYVSGWHVGHESEYYEEKDGYWIWTGSTPFSNFSDLNIKSVDFAKPGRHDCTITKTVVGDYGYSTENLISRGALNRTDLYTKDPIGSFETYTVSIYAESAVNEYGRHNPTHAIVWNTLDHSTETEGYKTTAEYSSYVTSAGGPLTISRKAASSIFATTDAIKYSIKFYDLSRKGKTCDAYSITATLYSDSSETPERDVTIKFPSNSPDGVIDSLDGTVTLNVGDYLVVPGGKLNLGTTYDIYSTQKKDDYYHIVSARSSFEDRFFNDVRWATGDALSLKYGENLPKQSETQETVVVNDVTVVGLSLESEKTNSCILAYDCQTTTPTGFMINNSPYIALIVIPAGLIFSWYIYRRKRNKIL